MDPNHKHNLNNLLITNYNADGITRQRSSIIVFLSQHNVDIICVSETHLTNEQILKIPGYNIYRNDRQSNTASGGVAIIYKKNITAHQLDLPKTNTIETVAIQVELQNQQKLKIIAAYKQPNKKIAANDLQNIFNDNTPTLLIGDLNCKNTIWGCRATNPDGARLYQSLTTHGIQISPPPEATHIPYRADHKEDILDIVLHKNFAAPITQTVLTELDSDHLPVLIYFARQPKISQGLPKLINGKVDWKMFNETMQQNLTCPTALRNSGNIDKALDHLINAIKISITASTTVQKSKNKRNHYTPPLGILNLISEKHKLKRIWVTTRNEQIKPHLNYHSRQIKKQLDQLRINNYAKYISELEPRDPSMWRATRRILNQYSPIPVIKSDNKTYSSNEEKCEIFAITLAQTFSTSCSKPANLNTQQVNDYVNNNIPAHSNASIIPVTPAEIKQIINKLPTKRAPGADLIPNCLLKGLPMKALVYLTSLFNGCLRIGYFPDQWKYAHVRLFHKPGKKQNDPTGYRPISLLSTLSKVFEKTIHSRLVQHVSVNDVIPKFQFGFRNNYSTVQQLTRITELIEHGFENKLYTVAAFLDIKQAFDRVWHNGLIYKLMQIQVPPYLLLTIKSFLTKRSFSTVINNHISEPKLIEAGVPQGSILAPILFNIYMHDIPEVENSSLAMFADDTAIISQHSDLAAAVSQL
uniref:Reverse transcriptase domain-containing protein n=1 Tax=Photinus pyralis TaxID=7054 RepID=A0A1Y1K0C8_PHOPY